MACHRLEYRNAVCKKQQCRVCMVSGLLEVRGYSVLATTMSAVVSNHCRVASRVIGVSGVSTWSSVQMVAMRWLLYECRRNSSHTLNTFPPLSTCIHRVSSQMLQSEPTCVGEPQPIISNTFWHSYRKWKSPK